MDSQLVDNENQNIQNSEIFSFKSANENNKIKLSFSYQRFQSEKKHKTQFHYFKDFYNSKFNKSLNSQLQTQSYVKSSSNLLKYEDYSKQEEYRNNELFINTNLQQLHQSYNHIPNFQKLDFQFQSKCLIFNRPQSLIPRDEPIEIIDYTQSKLQKFVQKIKYNNIVCKQNLKCIQSEIRQINKDIFKLQQELDEKKKKSVKNYIMSKHKENNKLKMIEIQVKTNGDINQNKRDNQKTFDNIQKLQQDNEQVVKIIEQEKNLLKQINERIHDQYLKYKQLKAENEKNKQNVQQQSKYLNNYIAQNDGLVYLKLQLKNRKNVIKNFENILECKVISC